MKQYKLNPKTRIGHIHLTVSDLEKSVKFYGEILGFEITQQWNGAVFLSAGGYHHHIGLNTWGTGRSKPEEGQVGLYHFAILYPGRKELGLALKRLFEADYPIEGTADHGVSEAIYLRDPDGNGLELYADRDEKNWPRDKNGKIVMGTKALDIKGLLGEAGQAGKKG